jgi:hypothetical protein
VDSVSIEVYILSTVRVRSIVVFTLAGVFAASCSSADTTTTAAPPGRILEVPSGEAPMIDGIIGTGEWDSATSTIMTDGSPVHWMFTDETLYVALDGGAVGAVNLAIATGDEIWILHSSAALGSALYVHEGSTWTLSHAFNWCCRSTTDDTDRRNLLDEESWQANIGFTGDVGVVEYEVAVPWVGGLVAVSYQTEASDPAYWPADLSGEAEADLIGPWPEAEEFNLDEWYLLEATNE